MTRRKWLRAALIGGVLLLVASFAFSRALRAGAVRRYLIAHLAASFGRPVDVSWFDFSLLDGARIEAHFVSVSDDPQFGNEYFLRSDTLTAGLRWSALLAGRFEFGSVSLSRPSLNLARDAGGHWNVERWLPPATAQSSAHPGFMGPRDPSTEIQAARPVRIDVDGGRINFKRGDNKSPFALEDVSGRVEQNGAGRWQLDLEAHPMRAGVELQDIGTLRLRGSIAGTSARLQPADINLTWRAASVADTLRLILQNDYGMRGRLDLDFNAHIAPTPVTSPAATSDARLARWSISAVARWTGMHGWRLTGRDSDPAANLSVEMNWNPSEARAEIGKLLVEMPASRLQGRGELDWAHGIRPEVQFDSSTLGLGDVLSWYRALKPDVAEDLRADGVLALNAKLGGWPMQLQQGAIASVGGTLTAKSLPAALHIGAMNAKASPGRIDFAPVELSFAPAPSTVVADHDRPAEELRNSFAVRGAYSPKTNPAKMPPVDWDLSVEGATSRAQDWLALSAAVAQPINSDWSASGGLLVKMHATHRAGVAGLAWLGSMDILAADLSPAYINQPVHLPKANVEFAPSQRTITLASAEAFGAVWHGSITRKVSDKEWTFDLSADHVDATDLDRWLGPRARPGFFSRFTAAKSEAVVAPLGDSLVTRLTARGRLRIDMVEVPPMRIENFDGQAELAGRTIQIRKAQANFFGGKISGTFDARLLPDAAYEFQGLFDRVDLTQLARAVPFMDNRIGGSISASLALSAHGIGRQDLIGSMQGQGTLSGRNVTLHGVDLSAVFPGADSQIVFDPSSSVQGAYRIQNGGIDLSNLALVNSGGRLEADGRIDFNHALNIQGRIAFDKGSAYRSPATSPAFLLGGTIEAPKIAFPSASTDPRSPSPVRAR
jgi:uncharacterized protein involved in outer membrane biogenesis